MGELAWRYAWFACRRARAMGEASRMMRLPIENGEFFAPAEVGAAVSRLDD